MKKCDVFTGRPEHSAAMPVLFLLRGPKMVFFAPEERHVAPINVEFRSSMPNLTFIWSEMWEYSLQNCQNLKFRILIINLPLRGDLFAVFLR